MHTPTVSQSNHHIAPRGMVRPVVHPYHHIEQHKDTFAVAEIQLFGGTLPAGQSTSEEQILRTNGGANLPFLNVRETAGGSWPNT